METVIEIKKIQGSAVLCLENGERLKVPVSLFRERPVRKGETIDPTLYRQFMVQRGYSHALDSAVKMLSLCDRSENEIRERLFRAGYPEICVSRVIQKLCAEELLDDAAFARNWAQSRLHKYGRNRLRQELSRRGVDRETVRETVERLSDEDQLADAVRLTGKYLARTHGDMDRKLYQRTLAMLARHGYDADIARRALETIARGEDGAEWEEEDVKEMFAWKPGREE
ncbi:MAG: regulatory protein RecX [Clostridia bacterium]|nr:regulatory protein RecX [Clostridia bacterium]